MSMICASTLVFVALAWGQTGPKNLPLNRIDRNSCWYGVKNIDFRRGAPDAVLLIDIGHQGKNEQRPHYQLVTSLDGSIRQDDRDSTRLIAKGKVISGAGLQTGRVATVVLPADLGSSVTSYVPFKPGRYLVIGMLPKNQLLPESEIIASGTGATKTAYTNEVFGLAVFPTKATKVNDAVDPYERVCSNLVLALKGSERDFVTRITSLMRNCVDKKNESRPQVQPPSGWLSLLYGIAEQSRDSYFRAKCYETLMYFGVMNVEGKFATALMDCAIDPKLFESGPDYGGLGPCFDETGGRASSNGDQSYWDRSPYSHDRAVTTALNGKNLAIRYYLIDQVIHVTAPDDWSKFVLLLQNPPDPSWQEMMVRAFEFWRYGKPTPKIEYGIVNGIRRVTNMPELIKFYTEEYVNRNQTKVTNVKP